MNKFASALIATLVVSSFLLVASTTKTTEIPMELRAAIEATRHAIVPDGAGYKASNPGQSLELRFERTAATVIVPDGEAHLRLAGYGRSTQLLRPEGATLTASTNRVEYRHSLLTEWYVNDRQGLEQGFTLAERVEGDGPLVVALIVEGLTPRLEGPEAVVLERDGEAVLRYARCCGMQG
jgi:hypothetical protein